MDFFKQGLDELERAGLRRRTLALPGTGGKIRLPDGSILLNFSSNDYLNLAGDEYVKAKAIAAVQRWGCGATGSRLMSGTLSLHEELEAALAGLLGRTTALVFSNGFGMNVGIVSAVAGDGDVIFSDRLNHASLIDGARLSHAAIQRFEHNDMASLRQALATTPCPGHRVIVSESVFSMDGDIAPVAALRELAKEFDALLLLDEAHAIGVFGQGAGVNREAACRSAGSAGPPAADQVAAKPFAVAEQLGEDALLTIGTLGKSLGSVGGFVACTCDTREYLLNRARSFVFSTALPPPSVAAALAAVERIAGDPGMGTRLLQLARGFHERLKREGLRLSPFASQIIPVHIGENERAMLAAARLRERGLLVTGIRPPTVPPGTARLRLSVTLAHTEQDLAGAAEQIGEVVREIVPS